MNEDGMAYENRGHNIEENSQNNVRLSPDISGAPGAEGDWSSRKWARSSKGEVFKKLRVHTVTKHANMLLFNNWLSWIRIGCKFTEDQTKEKVSFVPGKP